MKKAAFLIPIAFLLSGCRAVSKALYTYKVQNPEANLLSMAWDVVGPFVIIAIVLFALFWLYVIFIYKSPGDMW